MSAGSGMDTKPLAVRVTHLKDEAAVRSALTAFLDAHGGDGWLCTTDRVSRLGPGSSLDSAPPLSAEAVSGDRSLSLTYVDASAGWRLTTLVEETGAETYWVVDHHFVAIDPELGRDDRARGRKLRARYRVYWPRTATLVGALPGDCPQVGPVAARFLGFGPSKEAT